MPDDFEDWCGKKAPPSRYPHDTPGLASWKPEDEPKFFAMLAEEGH